MYQLHAIPAFSDNYIWCVTDHASGEALVVDPGDAKPVQAFMQEQNVTLGAILLTHHHPDHSAGINALLKSADVPVYGPADSPFPKVTQPLRENDTLDWQDFQFTVYEVPGHTLDHIAFYSDQSPMESPLLFCGDAIFVCGCGRLFEGTPEQMQASLAKLRQLPDDTVVCGAHEYTLANLSFSRAVLPDDAGLTKLESECQALRDKGEPTLPSRMDLEKRHNLFLRWDDPAVMSAAADYGRQQGIHTDPNRPEQVFAAIRHWKDHF